MWDPSDVRLKILIVSRIRNFKKTPKIIPKSSSWRSTQDHGLTKNWAKTTIFTIVLYSRLRAVLALSARTFYLVMWAYIGFYTNGHISKSSRNINLILVWYQQGLRASSLQFTSQLEFNAIFRDGFTLRHELTAGSEIRDPVPAKFKHVTNIVTCTCIMLWLRHVRAGAEISKKLTSNPRLSAKNTPLFLFSEMGHSLQIFV